MGRSSNRDRRARRRAGFATHAKAVMLLAFAILFVGLAEPVRTLIAARGDRLAVAAVPAR